MLALGKCLNFNAPVLATGLLLVCWRFGQSCDVVLHSKTSVQGNSQK
jgi:hypothetical protein